MSWHSYCVFLLVGKRRRLSRKEPHVDLRPAGKNLVLKTSDDTKSEIHSMAPSAYRHSDSATKVGLLASFKPFNLSFSLSLSHALQMSTSRETTQLRELRRNAVGAANLKFKLSPVSLCPSCPATIALHAPTYPT